MTNVSSLSLSLPLFPQPFHQHCRIDDVINVIESLNTQVRSLISLRQRARSMLPLPQLYQYTARQLGI